MSPSLPLSHLSREPPLRFPLDSHRATCCHDLRRLHLHPQTSTIYEPRKLMLPEQEFVRRSSGSASMEDGSMSEIQLNICKTDAVDYIVTGSWSDKAVKGQKYCKPKRDLVWGKVYKDSIF